MLCCFGVAVVGVVVGVVVVVVLVESCVVNGACAVANSDCNLDRERRCDGCKDCFLVVVVVVVVWRRFVVIGLTLWVDALCRCIVHKGVYAVSCRDLQVSIVEIELFG